MAFIRIYVTEKEWVAGTGDKPVQKDVKRYLAEVDGTITGAADIAADMIKRYSRIYRNVQSETSS